MMEQCNTWKCKPAYCYKWKNDENWMQHILGVLMKATRSVRRKVRQHENSASQDGERRRPCSGPLGGDPFRDNYELAHINVYKCIDWKTLKFLRLWDRRKNVLFCRKSESLAPSRNIVAEKASSAVDDLSYNSKTSALYVFQVCTLRSKRWRVRTGQANTPASDMYLRWHKLAPSFSRFLPSRIR